MGLGFVWAIQFAPTLSWSPKLPPQDADSVAKIVRIVILIPQAKDVGVCFIAGAPFVHEAIVFDSAVWNGLAVYDLDQVPLQAVFALPGI